jgi:hypothetical protein
MVGVGKSLVPLWDSGVSDFAHYEGQRSHSGVREVLCPGAARERARVPLPREQGSVMKNVRSLHETLRSYIVGEGRVLAIAASYCHGTPQCDRTERAIAGCNTTCRPWRHVGRTHIPWRHFTLPTYHSGSWDRPNNMVAVQGLLEKV